MKTKLLIFTFIFMMFSVAGFAGEEGKYGKKITLQDTTKISTIMENPDKFVGKKVLVEGLILEVCPKRGCWINLASDKEFQQIRIKVKDGEIVFPMEAKGKTATVEGEFQIFELSKEQVINMKKHQAEEKGEEFDESTVKGGETYYQIKGIGAVISK
ncbi:MAG: DUF4920 domain-containing protein [Deferribacteres bacterium]|nr:DUF4920 domain-containing protein [candidate division KSB1 bacterium]MCB9503039.1 DUF4920 domain-containing protein [Deferribacteres bacterium]